MKKIFTLIAATLMAVGAQAQKVISLAGLQHSDFTYDKNVITPSTWTDSKDETNTAPAFNVNSSTITPLTLTDKDIAFWYKGTNKTNFFILNTEYFSCGGKNVELRIANIKKGQKITLAVAAKADYATGDIPAFSATGAQMEGDAPELRVKNEFKDIVFSASADGTVVIKETMKGYNIKSITITDGEFILKDGTYFIQYPGTEANAFTDGNGFKLQITGNTEKKYGKGDKFTIDGTTYQSIKGSNGAENTLTLPEGKVTSSITLYSVINADALGENPSFWQEVAGTKFKGDQEGEAFTTLKGSATSYDERTYNFKNGKLNTITFTNKNLQPYFLIKVTIETGTPVTPEAVEFVSTSGIETLKAAKGAKDGAIYNLAGQKVSKDFKGLIIRDGKKMIQK